MDNLKEVPDYRETDSIRISAPIYNKLYETKIEKNSLRLSYGFNSEEYSGSLKINFKSIKSDDKPKKSRLTQKVSTKSVNKIRSPQYLLKKGIVSP